MGNSRTENSIKIAYAGLFQKFLVLGLKFVQRTVFIYVLGASYLGLNETFANILGLLSLSELGISSAMAYHVYKPLADGQQELLQSLMAFYKRCYWCVGGVILVVGFCLIPALPHLVPMERSLAVNLTAVYLLYLLNTGLPYLLYAFRTVLPTADQKQYVVTNFNTVCEIAINLGDIVVLLVFGNYMLSLCLRMAITFAGGLILAHRIGRMYPFLSQKKPRPLEKKHIHMLFTNVKDIFIFHVASALFQATDNLVISSVLGTRQVGYYANYFLIMNAVNNTANMVVYSFHASIGNVVASESKEKQLKVFGEADFINTWVTIFCTVCFAQLLNPFIALWMRGMNDSAYVLSQALVLALCINYFFESHMRTLYMFREANGLFRYGKYRVALAGVVNVVLSLFLAQYLGLIGVFAATAAANIGICSFYYPKVVFEKGYGISCGFYRLRMLRDLFTAVAIYLVVRVCCSFLPGVGLLQLVLQAGVCAVVINLWLFLLYRKREEFSQLKLRVLAILQKRRSKGDKA